MLAYPSLVTALSLLVYLILTINVGRARAKYKVPPPAITGNLNFEQVFRVQQNTLEQLILFLPGLWLFSYYLNPIWGAAIGGFWLIGRILYAWGYYQAPEKRGLGFAISSLSGLILLGGSFVGIGLEILKNF